MVCPGCSGRLCLLRPNAARREEGLECRSLRGCFWVGVFRVFEDYMGICDVAPFKVEGLTCSTAREEGELGHAPCVDIQSQKRTAK